MVNPNSHAAVPPACLRWGARKDRRGLGLGVLLGLRHCGSVLLDPKLPCGHFKLGFNEPRAFAKLWESFFCFFFLVLSFNCWKVFSSCETLLLNSNGEILYNLDYSLLSNAQLCIFRHRV